MPSAEVDVTPDLVRRLVAAQHPDLASLPVTTLANGWDNVICLLGDEFLVRLPRRQVAVRPIINEQRWLPELRRVLPLPVPAPVRIGRPGSGYPWPWSIVPFLPGRVASRQPPVDPREAAACLARFLAALHAPAAADAPMNPYRGVPLADRAAALTENLSAVGDLVDGGSVRRAWRAALAAPPWHGPPVWLHGDLHPANILVHQGRISGVIDFGDITAGDPAADLSVAWMLLPADCHGLFQSAYRTAVRHGPGAGLWTRARGWAMVLSLVFIAHSADNPELFDIGRRTMDAVLAGAAR